MWDKKVYLNIYVNAPLIYMDTEHRNASSEGWASISVELGKNNVKIITNNIKSQQITYEFNAARLTVTLHIVVIIKLPLHIIFMSRF